MDLAIVYKIVNLSVLPAWGLLMFAPNWRLTERCVHAAFMPLILAAVYIYFLGWGIFFGGGAEGAGMGSLNAVMTLFDSPVSMIAGWVHYLAFDLFVGAWIVRDGQRRGTGPLLRLPCLVFTLMFGPVGLAMYFVVRLVKGEGLRLTEV